MSKHQKIESVIFDLDGVVTKTALVHAAAWKAMFDEALRARAAQEGGPFQEFTIEGDYRQYVDGKPRYEGVKSFLESRDIHLEFGTPDDDPEAETVCGLGNRKNIKFRQVLQTDGVEVYPTTITLIQELHQKKIPVGVASSSKNCQYVLQSANIEALFLTRVDGAVSAELGLKGKPNGDIFVRAAQNLGADPSRSVVVEDAVSGVQAGRNGAFGLVIGLARENNADQLKENGAHVVIDDFEGVDVAQVSEWFNEYIS